MIKLKNIFILLPLWILLFLKNGQAIEDQNCKQIVNDFLKTSSSHLARIPDEYRIQNPPLSNFILIIKNSSADIVLNESKKSFLEKTDIIILNREFKKLLKDLENKDFIKELQQSEASYQETLLKLKELRKNAAILRTIFVVFSEDHLSPKYFEEFTKNLGKLNDVIEFKSFKLVPKRAHATRDSFKMAEIKKEIKKFHPSTPKETKHHLYKIRDGVLEMLEQDQLSIDEFHEIRKDMKHFMATIQIMKIHDDRPEMLNSFKFLTELNDKLGGLRDESLKNELTTINEEMVNDQSEFQNIPENLKLEIKQFFQGLKIIIE